MSSVPLWFAPSGTDDWYTDLMFTLGEYRHCGDSFYLHVDETLMSDTDVSGALARLLDLWLEELDVLRLRRGTTFLPFDFGDEGSLWMRVRVGNDDEATVEVGASAVGGMSPSGFQVAITDFADTGEVDKARAPNGFETLDVGALTCDLDTLIATVTRNRDELNAVSRRAVRPGRATVVTDVEWDSWEWGDAWSPGAVVAGESPPAPVVASARSESEEMLLLPEQYSWGPGTVVIGLLGVLLFAFMASVLPAGDWRLYVVPAVTVIAARVVMASAPIRDLFDLPLMLTRDGYAIGTHWTPWADVAGFTSTDRFVRVLYMPGCQPKRPAKITAVLAFFGVPRPPTYISTRYRTGEQSLEDILRKWHRGRPTSTASGDPP